MKVLSIAALLALASSASAFVPSVAPIRTWCVCDVVRCEGHENEWSQRQRYRLGVRFWSTLTLCSVENRTAYFKNTSSEIVASNDFYLWKGERRIEPKGECGICLRRFQGFSINHVNEDYLTGQKSHTQKSVAWDQFASRTLHCYWAMWCRQIRFVAYFSLWCVMRSSRYGSYE